MKKQLVLILLLVLASSVAYASDEKGKLGVGVVLGAPTGLSVKYWESERIAYQGTLGGMVKGGLMIGADYLIHTKALRDPLFPFYYGGGVFIGDAGFGGPDYSRGRFALGVRAAFGVDYLVPASPFDIAVELGPSLLLTPVVGMGIELSVAFRFYP